MTNEPYKTLTTLLTEQHYRREVEQELRRENFLAARELGIFANKKNLAVYKKRVAEIRATERQEENQYSAFVFGRNSHG